MDSRFGKLLWESPGNTMKLMENLIKIPGITFNSHRETDRETLGTHQRVSERARKFQESPLTVAGKQTGKLRETNMKNNKNMKIKQYIARS